jgi:phosphoglucomutase
LSFAVRELNADAGVVLTASHNPAHDNGFKAYGSDGAQLVEPAASRVIAAVNAITSDVYEARPLGERGEIRWLGEEMDRRYMDRLRGNLLRPELLDKEPLKVVFTNLHGTGGQIVVPMLSELGFEVSTVMSQDERDGRFPTVASPNPENGPALEMAIRQADDEQADLVIGTDPDADRMGVAVRNLDGDMELLTGNQIGSLMAWYRIKTMVELGILNEANRGRAVVVKTFVTTELQRAIAEAAGVGLVNTLTGFKYIAAKLKKYEDAIPAEKKGAGYRTLSEAQTRALRLEYSRFFVFGGEESYGYLGCDYVRDKDANGAAVMFAEVAAYARSEELTVPELLDRIYDEFGFYLERGKALVMEGADGAMKIGALAASYSSNPPEVVDGARVTRVRDFARDELYDEEGDLLPKEGMLFVELEDGRAFAVRPSGTEPKIKFYLFGHARPGGSLTKAKDLVYAMVESLWEAVERDAHERMKGELTHA